MEYKDYYNILGIVKNTAAPTLTGLVSPTILAGTQGSQTIRLKSEGMPGRRDSSLLDDLLATIHIRIPKEPNNK